jgi:hypothetical protein
VMRFIIVCICVLALLASTCAWAGTSGPLTVTAKSGGKTSVPWTYSWAGQSSYTLAAPVTLKASDGTVMGMLNSLTCGMGSDPFVTLNFAVQAVGPASF